MNTKVSKRVCFSITTIGILLALALRSPAAPLTAGDPILLPGTHGGYDFIRIDTAANRLLLGHEGNKSFDVFDLGSKKLLKIVPTGTAQDVAVDVKRGNYYVSGNDPSRMVIVDATKLEITGDVPVPKDTDLIGFNPTTGLVYECNDTAGSTGKLVDRATTGARVDEMAYDPGLHRAYCASRVGKISVVAVEPGRLSALGEVSDQPGTGDIAVDPATHTVWIAYSKGDQCFVQPYTATK
jgi:DNA-binding beta-propeller fold protein YncE